MHNSKQGRIKKIREITEYGMQVELDNDVQVYINFNPNTINISMSGLHLDKPTTIEELQWAKIEHSLANNVTIQYNPHHDK